LSLYLLFQSGLSEADASNQAVLGERTVDLYLDKQGYLCGYPGRREVFAYPTEPGYLAVAERASAPAKSTSVENDYTRVFAFRDRQNVEHLVYVAGGILYVKDGNTGRALYTFRGRVDDGQYFPEMFEHEGLLIIVNFGDPVLLWDGYKGVHPLGVHETPHVPEVRAQSVPGAGDADPYANPTVWLYAPDEPTSGPAENVDAQDAAISGIYQSMIQFKDEYGNKSRPSPATPLWEVLPRGGANDSFLHATIEWLPPQVDPHIHAVLISRCLNLHKSDVQGGLSAYDIYFEEAECVGTTRHHFTHQLSDNDLSSLPLTDLTVGPPPQSSMGCSWRGHVFLAGQVDPTRVSWSDTGFSGQFRESQSYRGKDHVTALVPMEDRVAVITKSSVEILYEAASGTIAVLEQNDAIGSRYGRSIINLGGVLFGLWNDGWGFYDGRQFTEVPVPYYLSNVYLDQRHYVYSATKYQDYYLVGVRKDSVSDYNNYILMYHLKQSLWFLVADSSYDFTNWRGQLVGCDTTLWELFKGDHASSPVLHLRGLLPPNGNPLGVRSLTGIRLYGLPMGNNTASIEVSGEGNPEVSLSRTEAQKLNPTFNRMFKQVGFNYWNQPGLEWADQPSWTSDRDSWMDLDLDRQLAANTHDVVITLPAVPVKLRGIEVEFGPEKPAP